MAIFGCLVMAVWLSFLAVWFFIYSAIRFQPYGPTSQYMVTTSVRGKYFFEMGPKIVVPNESEQRTKMAEGEREKKITNTFFVTSRQCYSKLIQILIDEQ